MTTRLAQRAHTISNLNPLWIFISVLLIDYLNKNIMIAIQIM